MLNDQILVLVLHEDLRYLYFLFLGSVCTDDRVSAPKIMTIFPMLPSVNAIQNENQILCHSRYICIYLGQQS